MLVEHRAAILFAIKGLQGQIALLNKLLAFFRSGIGRKAKRRWHPRWGIYQTHRMQIAAPIHFHAIATAGFHFANDSATGPSDDHVVGFAWLDEHGNIVAELHSSISMVFKLVVQIYDTVSRRDHIEAKAAIGIRRPVIIDIERWLGTAIGIVHLIIRVQSNAVVWFDFVANTQNASHVSPWLQRDLATLEHVIECGSWCDGGNRF